MNLQNSSIRKLIFGSSMLLTFVGPSVAQQLFPAGLSLEPQLQSEKSAPQPGQLPPTEQPGVRAEGKTREGEDKRVFGVLPNYRTAEMSAKNQPITAKRKLHIAVKDSFDYPLVILSAGFAGLYQLTDTHPQFGQGMQGYLKRFGTNYTDQVMGNMLTEGILPSLLREDPRYFRMATGSTKHRTLYALSRIFVTRTDAGRSSFNYAEVFGNGIATAVGLSYYSDNRNPQDYFRNLGVQLATDASSQVLKEFWPDIKRWLYAHHHKD